MAAGKPIVVFAGSAKGLEHLRSAYVVPDHDWQGLAKGILTLLEDPALAAALGANARERALAHFSWPDLSRRTVAVYRSLLASARKRP
jgi:glycosyltransferase involved in cell wall biosynthesis